MKSLNVVAAIIKYNDLVLCMQRKEGKYDYVSKKFEFPGGKIEEGETKPVALMRELFEEMDIKTNISESDFFMTTHHIYPDFEITMHAYICKVNTQDFVMKEHIGFKWLTTKELLTLDWASADIPIVEKLIKTL